MSTELFEEIFIKFILNPDYTVLLVGKDKYLKEAYYKLYELTLINPVWFKRTDYSFEITHNWKIIFSNNISYEGLVGYNRKIFIYFLGVIPTRFIDYAITMYGKENIFGRLTNV